MGFFSDMNMEQETDREQGIDCQAKAISANDKQVETVPLSETAAVVQAVPSASAESKPEPEKVEPTEEEKRKAHEEAEAKRKAEWEEKQRQRKEKEKIAWEKAIAMDDDALIATSVKRLGDAIYGIFVSDSTVSRITEKILPVSKEWQQWPLESIHYHVRSKGQIVKKAVYIAIGIDLDACKDVLGMVGKMNKFILRK